MKNLVIHFRHKTQKFDVSEWGRPQEFIQYYRIAGLTEETTLKEIISKCRDLAGNKDLYELEILNNLEFFTEATEEEMKLIFV